MSTLLNEFSEQSLAQVLHDGLLTNVRKGLKEKLMTQLEKDVDAVIDRYISGLKGKVEAHRSFKDDQVVFNVMLDGVHKKFD